MNGFNMGYRERFANAPGMYNGLKVFVNDHLIGEYVKRTWKERLFSRPWKPCVKTKWNQNSGEKVIKDGQFLKFKDELHCNSVTLKALNEAIDNQ